MRHRWFSRISVVGLLCLLLASGGITQDIQTNIGSEDAIQLVNPTTPSAISCSTAVRHRSVRIAGDTAPANLSAVNPQIVPGTAAGQLCDLYCLSATNTVTFGNGNGLELALTGSFVCGDPIYGRYLPLYWSAADSLWRQRGLAQDSVTPNQVTLDNAFDTGDGTLGEVHAGKPFRLNGASLNYRLYENAGVGVGGWFTAGGVRLPDHWNCPDAGSCELQGTGVTIGTIDGTAATLTWATAPLYTDGLKQLFNPNGTNAGLNVGSQAGDPSTLVNGDVWYNSTTGKFRCRENGASTDCIGAAGGSGDITDVWGCTSDNCNSLTAASGDSFDAGSADSSKPAARGTTLPGTCAEGDLYHETDSGGTELSICTSTNTFTKIGDVAADDTSTTTQNIVAYSTTGGKNITELTGTQGDVLYHNGTSWAKLAAGTSGHFLKTNGAGANPAWAASAGGGSFRTSESMKFSSILAGSGVAFADPIDGTNIDYGVVRYLDNQATDGCTFWQHKVKANLSTTPAWEVRLVHKAVSGAGANVDLRVRALPVATGEALDTTPTALYNFTATAVNTSANLTETTINCGSNCDGTVALAARDLLMVEICRDSDDATNDTLAVDWLLLDVSVEYALN